MKIILFCLSLFLITTPLHPTILVTGPGTATNPAYSFNAQIAVTAFDPYTGIFYVGTEQGTDPTIQYAQRSVQGVTPTFIATGETNSIEFLTLAARYGAAAIAVPYVLENMSTNFMADQINIINPTGTISQNFTPVNDASGDIDEDGMTTYGIVGLAASHDFIFAPVQPNAMQMDHNFGTTGSGIAVLSINPTTLAIAQVAANQGDTGIKAAIFDQTIAAVNIGLAGNPTLFPNGINNNIGVSLIWDTRLYRLYIPVLAQINAAPGAGAKSVVVGQILDPFGHLQFNSIAPDGAFTPGDLTEIVGYLKAPADATQPYISVNFVKVMHCSTGPSYLIVNGDVGADDNVSNLFYAIPLVDVHDPLDPNQGTEADKNSALVHGRFVVPATTASGMTLNTDTAALVGAGAFPIDPSQLISDMQVTGDTVYVSLSTTPSSVSDTGILYSQAMFDETGKVVGWTPWTRHAFPIAAFPTQSPSTMSPISFFSVDPFNALTWAVDTGTLRIVRTTAWDNPQSMPGFINTSLAGMLNAAIPCKASAVLDLDQSTPGFTDGNVDQPYRYALFGSVGTVTFALTSQGITNTLNSPQLVTQNYAHHRYFLVTQLPTQELVTSLEYARQLPGDPLNYFFAGTSDGLYVFGDEFGNGFDANDLGLLDHYPFSHHHHHHGWIKVESSLIPGAILDIKTSGLALYVLALTTSPQFPLQTTLYRIPFNSTILSMFNPANIYTIAKSNTGIFADAYLFSGMQIIMTSYDTEQLVLTTSRGIYQSEKFDGVQFAIDQVDANWQPPYFYNTLYFNGIAGVDNASITGSLQTKVWPFGYQDTPITSLDTRSLWTQLNGTTNASIFRFVPRFFNADSPGSIFFGLPQTTYFWSDGARRLAIVSGFENACQLPIGPVCDLPSGCLVQDIFSLPYDVIGDGVTSLDTQFLAGQPLSTHSRFYWIKDIGSTGIVLAGTESGVVALE